MVMVFIPAPAVEVVCIRVNCSTRSQLDEETILGLFCDRQPNVEPWLPQLVELFSTVPVSLVERFIRENGISIENVKNVFYQLPEVWQNSKFKKMLENGELHG